MGRHPIRLQSLPPHRPSRKRIDINHPDIAPNLDLATSCSFVRSDDPAILAGLASPTEAGNGDCSNKAAVQDVYGHGTHVASTIAAPVNGIGIAGVAPRAPCRRVPGRPQRTRPCSRA